MATIPFQKLAKDSRAASRASRCGLSCASAKPCASATAFIARTRAADALKIDAPILQQGVEHTPGESAV